MKTIIYSGYKRRLSGVLLAILLLGAAVVYFLTYRQNYLVVPPSQTAEPVRRPGCSCPLDRNLPILIIETDGQDIDVMPSRTQKIVHGTEMVLWETSPRYRVNLSLYEPEEHGYTCVCGAAEPVVNQKVTINLRGQSSMSMPKKQYTLNLLDDAGDPQPISLLGMPEDYQWVLNASYMDKSLIRNALAYTMAGQTMEYAPRYEFCEVLINSGNSPTTFVDHYAGVYLLLEKIERRPHRIDIKKADTRYSDISFIFSRDKIKADDDIYYTDWGTLDDEFIVGNDGRIRQRAVLTGNYPGASMTSEYRARIIDYINRFEYALSSKEFDKDGVGYREYIGVDSFVQFAMVNEVFKNVDGGEVSTYFYKDLGGKMKAGPIWDFDLTLGNSSIQEMQDPAGLRITDVSWFSRMFQDRSFCAEYERVYRLLRKSQWENAKVEAMVDDIIRKLGPAALRNTQRWYSDPISYAGYDYQQEVEDLKEFIRLRMEWMDRHIQLVYRIRENTL